MKKLTFGTPQEREAFRAGCEFGKREGMKKAAMLIQLAATSTEDFEESILQNSKEAKALREILTVSE